MEGTPLPPPIAAAQPRKRVWPLGLVQYNWRCTAQVLAINGCKPFYSWNSQTTLCSDPVAFFPAFCCFLVLTST